MELTDEHLLSMSLWGSNVSGRQSFILGAGITCSLSPSQGLDHGMNGLKLLSAYGSAVDILCVAASVSLEGSDSRCQIHGFDFSCFDLCDIQDIQSLVK